VGEADPGDPRRAAGAAARIGGLVTQYRWALGVWIAGVVCLVTMLLPSESPAHVVLVNAANFTAVVVFLLATLQMPANSRRVWWWMWVYLVLTVTGDVVYDIYRFRFQEEPFPSLADVFYLTAYAALIAALVLLVHRRQSGRNREVWLDTTVMSLAAACVVATVVIVPVLNSTSAPDFATAIALSYPLLDVVVLSVLIRLVIDVQRMNPALTLLTMSVACLLTADLVFQSLAAQGVVEDSPAWVDGLFLASVLLLAAAVTARGARRITQPSPARQRTKVRLIAMAVAALTAPTLLAFSVWSEVGSGARLLAVVSIAVILLILWGSLMLISLVEQQSALLADLARRDGLTGLPNRRTWDFELDRVATRTSQRGHPLTVAMMDLDLFKAYNDQHGHPEGDALLIECGRAWRSHLDPPAVLARYGGEEFAVLLPGIALEDAQPVLERLRRATPRDQTVSIGCAERLPDEPIQHTVDRADRALYEAKAAGRDRVIAHHAQPVAHDRTRG
jgi:diguanylate cyclase (GGDEF)-like protein